MTSEDWWGVAATVVVIGAGYWIYAAYDHKKQASEPVAPIAVPKTQTLPRPAGTLYIGTDKDGDVWTLDADSVSGHRDSRQGWVFIDETKDKSSSVASDRTLYLVDCGTTEAKRISTADYDVHGKAMTGHSYDPKDAKPEYYPPDTFGMHVVRMLCKPEFGV